MSHIGIYVTAAVGYKPLEQRWHFDSQKRLFYNLLKCTVLCIDNISPLGIRGVFLCVKIGKNIY